MNELKFDLNYALKLVNAYTVSTGMNCFVLDNDAQYLHCPSKTLFAVLSAINTITKYVKTLISMAVIRQSVLAGSISFFALWVWSIGFHQLQ